MESEGEQTGSGIRSELNPQSVPSVLVRGPHVPIYGCYPSFIINLIAPLSLSKMSQPGQKKYLFTLETAIRLRFVVDEPQCDI